MQDVPRTFQGATIAASIQTYGILNQGKQPCGPKSQVMFKRPWALTRDTRCTGLSQKFLHIIVFCMKS